MAKVYRFEQEARHSLFKGIELLSRVVVTTLGPKGRNVALDRLWGVPAVLHDGVSIAREIDIEDSFENMGAQLVKEAATKTNDTAGDGTTTSILLAYEIVKRGLRFIRKGTNAMSLKKGIDLAVEEVVKNLKEISRPVDTKEKVGQVATIASTKPEIGKMIAEAMEKVGEDGVISVGEGAAAKTDVEYKEGMEFDKGFASPHFVTDEKHTRAVIESPYLFLADQMIDNSSELVKVFRHIVEQKDNPSKDIVIIANGFTDGIIQTLLYNKEKETLRPLAVISPAFAERRTQILEDIAILTGGKVADKAHGVNFDYVNLEYFGRCEQVISDKNRTQIVGGLGARGLIEDRIKLIKSQIRKEKSDFEKSKLQERLAKMTGGAAIIKVGAQTEIELNEKKERVIDAVEATKSAVAEGYVLGGGIALRNIGQNSVLINEVGKRARKLGVDRDVFEDIMSGAECVFTALLIPHRVILQNAGYKKNILDKVEDRSVGIDVETGQQVDLVETGIIDPTKVVRSALQNAGSVASMVLTTEVLVANSPEDIERVQKSVQK